jgi:hypothetical protein
MIQFTDKLELDEAGQGKNVVATRYNPENHDIGGWLARALLSGVPVIRSN